jgi:putative peptidoglycan lipid II flippase
MLKVFFASAILGAVLAFASWHVDWLGLRAQPFARMGVLLATLTLAAAMYLSVLVLLGLRLRDFRRQAH